MFCFTSYIWYLIQLSWYSAGLWAGWLGF